jgi:anti-anti-sigma regulatory factor/anti-sigma regulatory factor (Ser/Thr protein kinase)
MLTAETDSSSAVTVVRLAGRLDLTTAVPVRTALHKALADHPVAIVVDLSGVVVVDDVTLTVFSAFARTAGEWPGCPLLLSAPDRPVRLDLDRLAITRTVAVYRDMATALAAARTIQAPRRLRSALPATLEAPLVARRTVRTACQAWRFPELVDDAELIITELVSNAVLHAGPPIELLLTLRDRFMHLSVRDQSPVKPERVLPDPDAGTGGRGLILLDAVAAGWGATDVADGKVVWATLRIKR